MGNWIISPSEDVVNNNDGSFVLPCSMSNVDYNITYVNDEGCSSNTVTYTYVTSGDCGGSCPVSGDIIIQQVVDAAGSHSTPIMRVKKDSTYTGYSFTSSDTSIINPSDVLTPTINDWYLVMANVAANTGDLSRTVDITVNMNGTTTPSTGCPYTIPVTQKGSCATVDNLYYVGPMHNYELAGNAQTGAGVAYVAYFSPYSSWSVQFTGGTYSFVRNATVTNEPGGPGGTKKVTVDIDENNTGADRTFKLLLTGAKTDGYNCTKTITITQAAKATTCTCNDMTINGTEEQSPTDFNYTCYIQNNTSSPVVIVAYSFIAGVSDYEEFHNVQTIPANSTSLFANTKLDNDYEGLYSVNVSEAKVYVGADEEREVPVSITPTTGLARGGSITLIYNG